MSGAIPLLRLHVLMTWKGKTLTSTNLLTQTKKWGTVVAQWLKCCATSRKVAGSIPDDIIGTSH